MNIVTQSFKDILCVMASTDQIHLNVFIVLHFYFSNIFTNKRIVAGRPGTVED